MKKSLLSRLGNAVAGLFFLAALAAASPAKAAAPFIDFNIGDSIQPIPLATNKFFDPSYFIWCSTVMKAKDNKYYMLYSRWPKTDGFYSWCITCEICLAVSDKPGGPYKHVKVALPRRGNQYWDGSAVHNPALTYYKGKYYLYYMGTNSSTPMTFPVNSMSTEAWYSYRNTQRIGVAVADSLTGDWTRFDKPVVDADKSNDANYDYMLVSNPSAIANDTGRVLIVYKQVAKGGDWHGGQVRFGAAFADSPTGPFVKSPKPIFVLPGTSTMVAEDPYLWFQDGNYYAVVRDVIGGFTGDAGGLALMTSANGTDWQAAAHPKVIGSRFAYDNGTMSASQLERPCLLHENGRPVYLFGATRQDAAQTNTYNVAVPIYSPKGTVTPDAISSRANGRVSVTGSNGADSTGYQTLSAAVERLNGKNQSGKDILITIKDTITDSREINLTGSAGMWKSLTIRPESANAAIYIPINTVAMILNGVSNVTIDGRVDGVGEAKNLSIQNTDTGNSQTIRLINDARNNIIRYCIIKGSSTGGTINFSTGKTTGNDNNLIDNCDIGDGAAMPVSAIVMNGSIGVATNDGNIITNSNLFNVSTSTAGTPVAINIIGNTHGTTVAKNHIYWSKPVAPTAALNFFGIVATGDGNIISDNVIGYPKGAESQKSVFAGSAGTRFIGIQVTGSVAEDKAPVINNNTIANLDITSSSAGDATVGVVSAIYAKALANSYVKITNNTIRDIKLNYSGVKAASVYWTLTGIMTFASANTITGNMIRSLSAIGSAADKTNMVRAIHIDKTCTLSATVSQNIISDIVSGDAGSSASNQAYGVFYGAQSGGTFDRNLIYNLKCSNSAGSAVNYGLVLYNLSTTATAPTTVKNNMIRLGVGVPEGAVFSGIYMQANSSASAQINVYHNSVYVGGLVETAVTGHTSAFTRAVSSATNIADMQNNIFENQRTGGSTGVHAVCRIANSTDFSAGYLTCNSNLYNQAVDINKFALVGTTVYDSFSSWKSLSVNQDLKSILSDPAFVAPTATMPDLHIQIGKLSGAEANGESSLSSSVKDDFDGELRASLTPTDIGADAFITTISSIENKNAQKNNWLIAANGDRLRIIGEMTGVATATVFDVTGRVALQVRLAPQFVNIVSLANISSGTYLVAITDSNTSRTIRFRKE